MRSEREVTRIYTEDGDQIDLFKHNDYIYVDNSIRELFRLTKIEAKEFADVLLELAIDDEA